MVSWGRQDEGKDSLGFFPLSEFCALSPPEQSGKGTSESFLRPEIHYGLFTSGKVGVGYNLFENEEGEEEGKGSWTNFSENVETCSNVFRKKLD